MAKQVPISSPEKTLQRFMSRAEAITLVGMVITVFSLFLTWRVTGPSAGVALLPGALQFFVNETGFNLRLHWPLLLGSVVSSLALLVPMNAKNRILLTAVQAAGGIVCFLIALRFLALQPGVLLGILGGVLLVFGAMDRFSTSAEPNSTL